MSTRIIEFTLLQNALDSISRAVELLAWKDIANDDSRLKQAILLTAQACELLLKERLRRVHPALIWEDVDKYPRLDARTVGVERAVSRLKQIGGIVLDADDLKIVTSLRNTRNAVEHFAWKTTREEANAIVGKALSFAIDFAEKQLDTNISCNFRSDDTWDQLLTQHDDFARNHGGRIASGMKAVGKLVQECSFCNAMTQDLTTGACSLCGHWERLSGADDDASDEVPF